MGDRNNENQVFMATKDYQIRKSLKYGSLTLIRNGGKGMGLAQYPGQDAVDFLAEIPWCI